MQDRIILGFLMEGRKTGYQIKQIMEKSTTFFYNTSFGSIYPCLRKLEDDGLVTCEEGVEDGRLKKSYSITTAGKRVFEEWMNQGPEISRVRDTTLLKLFFFSHIPHKKRVSQIEEYCVQLEEQIRVLAELEMELSRFRVDRFQMTTLRFGIEYYSRLRSWFGDFARKLKDDPEE